MKTHNIISRHGHLYDLVTGKRIVLEDGEQAVLVAPTQAILITPRPIGWRDDTPPTPKSSDRLESELDVRKIDGKVSSYERVLSAGEHVQMRLKSNIQNERKEFVFDVELLEDLFAFVKRNGEHVSFNDCLCVVRSEGSGRLRFFEEIWAASLNELYKNTYVHFFGGKGSNQGNAHEDFAYQGIALEKLAPMQALEKPISTRKLARDLGDKMQREMKNLDGM